MGVVNIEVKQRQMTIEKIIGQLGGFYGDAGAIAKEYAGLLLTNRSQALKQLPEFIERARNVCGKEGRAYESMVGGPNQDWIVPFFNIVGDVYPQLDWHQRTTFLTSCMNYFNGLRYDYSQNHVEMIHEPWLVGDIVVSNWLYWCGHEHNTRLLESKRTWQEVAPEFDTTKSAFWLAFPMYRWKEGALSLTTPDVQQGFLRNYPQLAERTLDAVAAMHGFRSEDPDCTKGLSKEEFIAKKLLSYDPQFHEKILRKIDEHKWIALPSR